MVSRLTVILLCCAALPQVCAQYKIPDILKKGTDAIKKGRFPQIPTQNPNQRGAQQQSVSADKCQAVVQWISILQREDPNIDFLHTAMGPKLFDQVTNLYRDESFIPLYGRSFSQTTAEERLAYFRNVLIPCSRSTGVNPTDQALLRQYQGLISRPFSLKGPADFSGDYVIAGLAQRQALVAWMQETIQGLNQLPASPAGFTELNSDLKRGQTDLDKLWPREQQAFLKTIADRQGSMARSILDGVSVAATQQAANGRDGIKAITALYASNTQFIQMLDASGKEQVQKQKDQALSAALQSAVPEEKRKLAAMPPGLDGAIALATWEHIFDAETRSLPQSPARQSLMDDAEQKRKSRLSAGLPEFKKLVAQYPKPRRNGLDAPGLMSQLFPQPTDKTLLDCQQYQSVLSARLAAIATETAAKEAAVAKKAAQEEAIASAKAVEALNKPVTATGTGLKTSCDTYAGHPKDKGRVVGIAGVTDEKIVPATAITACTEAVKRSPKTARYQFQLGRAYWAADRYPEALDAFLKAEEMDYAPAYFYIGMAYEDGLIEGEQPDLETARDMYMVAASEGFEPAIAAYQDFDEEEVSDIDYTELKKPDMMKALYEGDNASLSKSNSDALHYMIGVQSMLNDNDNLLGDLSAKCQALAETQISSDLQEFLTREGQQRLDSLRGSGADVLAALVGGMGAVGAHKEVEDEGQDDMFFVVGLTPGGCEGQTVQTIYKNLKAFVPEALKSVPGQKTLPAR